MPNPEPDWPAIAEAYARGEESERRIATRFGVNRTVLQNRALREGWRRPKGAARAGQTHRLVETGSLEPSERLLPPPRTRHSRRALMLRRLIRALDERGRLMDIENARLAETGEMRNPAEQEKHDRTLAALIRLYDKLTETTGRRKQPVASPQKEMSDDDANRLRASLAERLARLRPDEA